MIKSDAPISLFDTVRKLYAAGIVDHDFLPMVRYGSDNEPERTVSEGDSVIFCCRRGEREVELTEMFTDPSFDRVEREYLKNVRFVTLTRYHERLKNAVVAFPPREIKNTLAETISKAGLTQFHCAESEKFAHVTFFLNGGLTNPWPGEKDAMVPSLKDGFDQHPALSAPQVTDRVLSELGHYDFTVVNYANGDVIGHMSSNAAKVETAAAVSAQLGRLIPEAIRRNYITVVTADHGNLEEMTRENKTPNTSHTTNLVPFIVIDPLCETDIKIDNGALENIAPSVLQMLNVKQPEEMTAESLVKSHDFGQSRKVLLIILDGWGIGKNDENNPIFLASTPYWDSLLNYPHSFLQASGSYVGLAEGKTGNSEAGHLNIGAGRVVLQDDMRIEREIEDGSIRQNPAILEAIEHARKNGGVLHLIGLLSASSSHGSVNYLFPICEMARDLPQVYIHLVVDGQITVNSRTPDKLERFEEKLKAIGKGRLLTCTGRKYAMDRDSDYDRVKLAYDAMVLGKGMPFI